MSLILSFSLLSYAQYEANQQDNPFAAVKTAAVYKGKGAAKVFTQKRRRCGPPNWRCGSCIAGAVPLQLKSPNYVVATQHRGHYWVHPGVKKALEDYAKAANQRGHLPIYAECGLPRGGPIPQYHSTHQTGLDVDIRWQLIKKDKSAKEKRQKAEQVSPNSELDIFDFGVEKVQGSKNKYRMLAKFNKNWDEKTMVPFFKKILMDPRSKRFVTHAVVKQHLCELAEKKDKSLMKHLHKLNIFWGHSQHFHVSFRNCFGQGKKNCQDKDKYYTHENNKKHSGCLPHRILKWWMDRKDETIEWDPSAEPTAPKNYFESQVKAQACAEFKNLDEQDRPRACQRTAKQIKADERKREKELKEEQERLAKLKDSQSDKPLAEVPMEDKDFICREFSGHKVELVTEGKSKRVVPTRKVTKKYCLPRKCFELL